MARNLEESIHYFARPWAFRSEWRCHEPASDIDTALMDSLKVLDPDGPIREADMGRTLNDR